MKLKGVLLYSGGLDSTLAGLICEKLGIEIYPYHLKTPFCKCPKTSGNKITFLKNIKLEVAGIDYIKEVVFSPKYGYGRGMNPCIDCRIYLFKKAKKYLAEIKGDLLITGEVLSQRPKSQHFHQLMIIEKEAEVKGIVLRPLSAKLLPPTIFEEKGLIDREKLYAIKGRERKEQIRLLQEFGIFEIPPTSCGCLLVDENFSKRLKDFKDNLKGDFDLIDIEILKIGRHFRVDGKKYVIGRNKEENERLIKLGEIKNYLLIIPQNFNAPVLLSPDKEIEEKMFNLLSAYSKDKKKNFLVIIKKGKEIIKEENIIIASTPQKEDFQVYKI
ncbi:MAG: hypothetical protein N2323_04040 [candidate division WOR-3 bacterium]|nr:hypothetical protein [candidate division WOR-3 bacterium]MCX7837112.1 hypothetical protein [candidate division WOR-3 bacterium]MDW8113986.1 hypothetical protein [candidate division WOR-3 bacterium]